MRFGMIVNPMAGAASAERKAQALHAIKEVLGDCEIRGEDTRSREEFMQCAVELAREVEVLIVAGGDGSFSDAINAVDASAVLAFLPLGSGCACSMPWTCPRSLPGRPNRSRRAGCTSTI